MMSDLDDHLAAKNVVPPHRDMHAVRLVSIALKLSGTPIFGGSPDRGAPFSPRDLLARVFEWYRDAYGERNKMDMSLGYVVVELRGTLWRLRIPLAYGTVVPFADRNLQEKGRQIGTGSLPATHNVLTGLDEATQHYVNRLSDTEVGEVMQTYFSGYLAMAALDELRGHDLFKQAQGDYAHSVEALTATRALSKARWDTAQCAEKVFKGLLAQAGQSFPTNASLGHNIPHLGGLVSTQLGVTLSQTALAAVYCPPKVRYGEVDVDTAEALLAHRSLIQILGSLRAVASPLGTSPLRS
jgi:hypothetical protein